jgi:hypothetical protein
MGENPELDQLIRDIWDDDRTPSICLTDPDSYDDPAVAIALDIYWDQIEHGFFKKYEDYHCPCPMCMVNEYRASIWGQRMPSDGA